MTIERPLRLFVAAELPPAVLAALDQAQRELRASALPLRFVRPGGIHLTLQFIGDVPAPEAATIERALSEALGAFTPVALRTSGAGTFGGDNARVVWAGLAGELDALRALHSRVRSALAGTGVAAADERPFRPHLTLARVSPDATAAERRRIRELAAAATLASIEFAIASVALIRSELGAGGARYAALARFPASAAHTADR